MWWLVYLVLWDNISSQPITDAPDNGRHARQLDFGECCPCPGSRPMNPGARNLDSFSDSTSFSRAPVDDCPCRGRDADSDGEPSLFVPRTMRPQRPYVMPLDSKEEPKPLLHPEVGLASSVLETLREVTDEEYQEALARDAARSAARDSEPDVLDTAKNVVTIILNPNTEDDGTVSDASHVQESRCIHPLGARSDQVRQQEPVTPIFLEEIFQSPKESKLLHKNLFDMDGGASEVQERISSINGGVGLKLKSNPALNVLSNVKPLKTPNINIFKQLDINDALLKSENKISNGKLGLGKIPDFRLSPLLNKLKRPLSLKQPTGIFSNSKLNGIPKIGIQKTLSARTDENMDNSPAPSSKQEQLFENMNTDSKTFPRLTLNSLIHKATPLTSLSNLLNLKDVEMVAPKIVKASTSLPNLREQSELAQEQNNFDEESIVDDNCDSISKDTNIQVIPREKQINTEILDAVPSPSENHHIVDVIENQTEVSSKQLSEDSPGTDECAPKSEVTDDSKDSEEINDMKVNDNSLETASIETDESDNDGVIGTEQVGDDENQMINDGFVSELTESELDEQDLEADTSNQHIVADSDDEQNFENGDNFEAEHLENEDIMSNNETTRSDCKEKHVNEGEDSISEASSAIFQNVPTQDDIADNSSSQDNFRSEEVVTEVTPELFRTSNILPTIKESIMMKLDTLKNTNTKILNIKSVKNLGKPTTKDEYDQSETRSVFNDESSEMEGESKFTPVTQANHILEESNEDAGDTTSDVNIQDLQEMSDSILDMSNVKFDKKMPISKTDCKVDINDNSLKSDKVNSNQNEHIADDSKEELESSDLSPAATSLHTTIVETIIDNPLVSSEENDHNDDTMNNSQNTDSLSENTKNTCLNNLKLITTTPIPDIKVKNNEAPDGTNQQNEMTAEGSEPISNVLPQNSLLDNIVVQPPSLFNGGDLNIFSRPTQPIPNLLNLNAELPTLDEIRKGISDILGVETKNADEDLFEDYESDPAINPDMSNGASAKSTNTMLPSLTPLEDINLDIFQLQPLAQTGPFVPRIPSLNLNSYKAKLAIPKALNLKPVQFQSTLGNKVGLLGASLSVGKNNMRTSDRAKPKVSILNHKGSNILRSSLSTIPRLDDLQAAMRKNAQSLLNTPLTTPKVLPLEDTLRASQTISDNLRSHTENTMKNIQRSLRKKSFVIPKGKLAVPEVDILEMVSNAQDDMNDKLKAIHYDLKDRLTTIHENIVDQSRLPSFKIPIAQEINRKPQIRTNSRQPQPKIVTSRKDQRKPTFTKQIVPKSNDKLSVTKTTNQNKIKPFKIPTAASTLSQRRVEVPKLTATSIRPPFSKLLHRDSNVQLKDTKFTSAPRSLMNPHFKRPITRSKFKPFGDSKVTVSFSSTARPLTSRPLQSRPLSTTITPKPTPISLRNRPSLNSDLSSRPTSIRHKFKPIGDSRGFPSELSTFRVPAPVKPLNIKSANMNTPDIHHPNLLRESIASDSSRKSELIPNPNNKVKSLQQSSLIKDRARAVPAILRKPVQHLVWPTTTENALLSKVREALKVKMSDRKTSEKNLGSIQSSDQDMARSASENNNVMLPEPMKENVSYKCKMVCVREP